MPKSSWASPKGMREKCERRRGSANVAAAGANVIRRAMGARRGRLSAPWSRFHGVGRADVYIIIRVRACCCGESALIPADLTTHSPPKTCSRPRTATRPARAFSHSLPAHFRSPAPRRCTPVDLTTHSPPKAFSRPRTATRTARALSLPHAARCIPRRPHNPFPAEGRRPPQHSDTHCPSTFAPPRSAMHARRLRYAFLADLTTHSPPKTFSRPRTATRTARALSLPHAARCIPRRPHNPFPAEDLLPPPHSDTPSPSTSAPPRSPDAHPQAARCTPADLTTHSSSKAFAPPPPFRFGHKKTAPHSGCAMPNVSVDRRCGRSFGLVSRTLFAAVAGRWRVGVGLRPQPWALRSRRCGRVLRA